MPATGVSNERVAIRPMSHGTLIAKWVFSASWSGHPNTVNEAGGFSVSHSASIAASFTFCTSPVEYPDSSPSTITESAEASPKPEATANERIANDGSRPRSRYHDEMPSTNTDAAT